MVKDSAYYDGYWDNVGKYEWQEQKRQTEATALCDICGKTLDATKECAWTGCPLNWDEKRMDIIGSNGPVGYTEEDMK